MIKLNRILGWITLVFALAALLAQSAVPPIVTSFGVANNSPTFPPPPEFCAVVKAIPDSTTGITSGSAGTDSVFHYGQRFLASSNFTACKVVIRGGYAGNPVGLSIVVSVYDHNPADAGWPSNQLSYSQSLPLSQMSQASNPSDDSGLNNVVARIPPVNLTAGNIYWIVVFFPNPSVGSGNYFRWYSQETLSVINNQVFSYTTSPYTTTWGFYNNNTGFKAVLMGEAE
jgi:hypothetical protein